MSTSVIQSPTKSEGGWDTPPVSPLLPCNTKSFPTFPRYKVQIGCQLSYIFKFYSHNTKVHLRKSVFFWKNHFSGKCIICDLFFHSQSQKLDLECNIRILSSKLSRIDLAKLIPQFCSFCKTQEDQFSTLIFFAKRDARKRLEKSQG